MRSKGLIRDRLLDVLDRRGDKLTRAQIVERFGHRAAVVARGLAYAGQLDYRDGEFQRPAVPFARRLLADADACGAPTIPWELVPEVFAGIEFDEELLAQPEVR